MSFDRNGTSCLQLQELPQPTSRSAIADEGAGNDKDEIRLPQDRRTAQAKRISAQRRRDVPDLLRRGPGTAISARTSIESPSHKTAAEASIATGSDMESGLCGRPASNQQPLSLPDYCRCWYPRVSGCSMDVVSVLNRLRQASRVSGTHFCDNGNEFTSQILDLWAYHNKVSIEFRRPGKLTDNAFIESFNETFRAECLNAHWLESLKDARMPIMAWQQEYNESRPHRALGDVAPAEFGRQHRLKGKLVAENRAGD